jgi:hypothetical protein
MKSQSSMEKQIIDSEWSRMNEGWRRNAILGASSILIQRTYWQV